MTKDRERSETSWDRRRVAKTLAEDARTHPILDRIAAGAKALHSQVDLREQYTAIAGGPGPLADVFVAVADAAREDAFTREAIAFELLGHARTLARRENQRSARQAIEGERPPNREHNDRSERRSASVSAILGELVAALKTPR